VDQDALRERLGQRIQRCSGCFVAYYMKEMYLGPGGAFYCQNCKDDTMFHFDQFSRKLDLSRFASLRSEGEDPSS
jgi:hypothetical protein